MEAYVAGDAAAFQQLFARYAPLLLGLFRRRTRSDEDAQDLVQQTFLSVHRARLDWRAGATVRPWLFTIALNAHRELGRRKGRRREATLAAEPAAPVASTLEDKEDVARLLATLESLPEPQREVIELHWFQGASFGEIASIVGASVSAVKVRAHRGYERLRALLGERGAAREPR